MLSKRIPFHVFDSGVGMKSALLFSIFAFVLIYFQIVPAGLLLIFISLSLTYLGSVYVTMDGGASEPRQSLNKNLGVALIITSVATMAYGVRVLGEVSPEGKLQPEIYHIFIAPVLIGVFFIGRFLYQQRHELTIFLQYAAASAFCLFLALKNGDLNFESLFLLVALFSWLLIQIVFSQRGKIWPRR